MFKTLLRFVTSVVLCALIATQPVFAQAASNATNPAPQPTTQLPLMRATSATRGVEVRFLLLDSLSPATAVEGQLVRFAVAQDVIVNGVVVIPRGTPANGVVSDVNKAVPGKHNGYVTLELRDIPRANGASIKLMRNPPGEDECGDMGPCAALVTFVVLLSPLIVALLVVESPFLIAYAIKESHRHKLTPPVIVGEDIVLQPCKPESAYIRSNLKSLRLQTWAQSPATQRNLAELDQCQAHQNHTAIPTPSTINE